MMKVHMQKRSCAGVASFFAVTLMFLVGCAGSAQQKHQAMSSTQSMVHSHGQDVMPFDLKKTTHIFEMTDYGGIMQVVLKVPNNSKQIAMIQQHLQHEAKRFSAGDYSDPAKVHGAAMPGLKELSRAGPAIRIRYSPLSTGAQITFTSHEVRYITAVHRWFGAQLSDHGADATYR